MKSITESLAIKLHARYSLFIKKLEEKRVTLKGGRREAYKKILKKILIESNIEPNNSTLNYYLGETSKYWYDKKANMSERFTLLEKEKDKLRNDNEWNIYMNTLINIPTNTNLIESSRDVEKIVKESLIHDFDLAIQNINNIGGPQAATEDVVTPFEFEVAKEIEREFEINEIEEDFGNDVLREKVINISQKPKQKRSLWVQVTIVF